MNVHAVNSTDLTTRARIRNAAVELIGSHGFDRASLRMIAEAAGVSPALVVHHFGDKDGLHAACNAHVSAMFAVDQDDSTTPSPTIEAIRTALADPDAYGPALDYLARMLAEDRSPAADDLFDAILESTLRDVEHQQRTGTIRPQSDSRGSALLLTLLGLAPLVLSRHFARSVGEERLTPTAIARITLPLMELLTHGLYTDGSILEAARGAMIEAST